MDTHERELIELMMMIDVPIPFVAHRIDPPSQTVETSKAEIVDMFTQSYLMRRLEIAADVLYKGKFIRGFCHLYDGQARSISHWSPYDRVGVVNAVP